MKMIKSFINHFITNQKSYSADKNSKFNCYNIKINKKNEEKKSQNNLKEDRQERMVHF